MWNTATSTCLRQCVPLFCCNCKHLLQAHRRQMAAFRSRGGCREASQQRAEGFGAEAPGISTLQERQAVLGTTVRPGRCHRSGQSAILLGCHGQTDSFWRGNRLPAERRLIACRGSKKGRQTCQDSSTRALQSACRREPPTWSEALPRAESAISSR